MKVPKLLGPVAVLALVAAALMGASTASATTLCKENAKECQAAKQYLLPKKLNAHAEAVTVTPQGGVPVECLPSDMALTLDSNQGPNKGINGNVSSLTFGCGEQRPLPLCGSEEFAGLPYNAMLTETENERGLLTLSKGEGGGEPGVIFHCSGGSGSFTCEYREKNLQFEFDGTIVPAALIKLNSGKIPRSSGGSSCNGSVEISANYQIPESFGATTSLLTFGKSTGEECESSSISVERPSLEVTSLTDFRMSGCKGLCKAVTAEGLPYGGTYSVDATGMGAFTAKNLKFKMSNCIFGIECHYGATLVSFPISHYTDMIAKSQSLALEAGSSALCPKTEVALTGLFTATYAQYALVGNP